LARVCAGRRSRSSWSWSSKTACEKCAEGSFPFSTGRVRGIRLRKPSSLAWARAVPYSCVAGRCQRSAMGRKENAREGARLGASSQGGPEGAGLTSEATCIVRCQRGEMCKLGEAPPKHAVRLGRLSGGEWAGPREKGVVSVIRGADGWRETPAAGAYPELGDRSRLKAGKCIAYPAVAAGRQSPASTTPNGPDSVALPTAHCPLPTPASRTLERTPDHPPSVLQSAASVPKWCCFMVPCMAESVGTSPRYTQA
jgi:hypothetical protein